MDGPRSFYKDRDALEQVVESEKVAFVQAGDPINFHEDYHCKVLHSNYLNFLMLFQYTMSLSPADFSGVFFASAHLQKVA